MALTDNLISFWELEEASGTRNDSHSTNHLTDNAAVSSAAGKVGNAADFTAASTQYLSRTSNAALQTGNIDFSFAYWAKFKSTAAPAFSLVTKDVDTPSNSRDYTNDWDNNGKFRFYINGSGGGLIVSSAAFTALNTWHFVVSWHDSVGDTLNIQVDDGTVTSAATLAAVPQATGAEFRIGARAYAANQNYTNGVIDQVGFWKRVLTAAERTQLYNSGSGLAYSALGSTAVTRMLASAGVGT